MYLHRNGRRQPIPRSLPFFIDASNEVEKRSSSICSAVTDISKAQQVNPGLMGYKAVSLTVK
jgi:hypothetical protein